MVAWFLVLLVASLSLAILLAVRRPSNPLEGASYFDRHPTVVLTILAVVAAVIVFPVFVIGSLPHKLFRRRSSRLASGVR
ncbi:MAG: hypothetical protein HYY84_02135 [Deltaproteobacteria bacterium]|nr:hypothetical protein [Deltaproteobacteria bacterium]